MVCNCVCLYLCLLLVFVVLWPFVWIRFGDFTVYLIVLMVVGDCWEFGFSVDFDCCALAASVVFGFG